MNKTIKKLQIVFFLGVIFGCINPLTGFSFDLLFNDTLLNSFVETSDCATLSTLIPTETEFNNLNQDPYRVQLATIGYIESINEAYEDENMLLFISLLGEFKNLTTEICFDLLKRLASLHPF